MLAPNAFVQNRYLIVRRLGGGERSERRGPGLGSRDFRELGRHSHEVERGGQQQMHEPGFHQPVVA